MPEIRIIRHRTEKQQREILRPVDGRTGRKADLENLDPSGHPGCGGRELHMETVSGTDEAEGIPVEAEPEVHCIKSTGDGTVYPSAEPWEALLGREHPPVDLAAKKQDTCWKRKTSQPPKKKLKGIQALYYSYLYQMGVLKQKPKRISPVLRADIRKLDARIEQMEFLQKHQITTREELMAYRTSLEEQVQALIKERRRLYRSEPDSDRISQITEELKPLRKDIRICVRIEQQSKEMEERMHLAEQIHRQAEQEEEQTEKTRQPRTESR